MKNYALGLASAAAVLVAAVPANATILVNGATGVSFSAFDASTEGVLLASVATPSPALTFNSTFNAAVYRNTLGTLDFYFQVVRTGPGPANDNQITRMTNADYTGFTVDALVRTDDFDGAGIFLAANNSQFDGEMGSTTTVARDQSGDVIRTNFGMNGLRGTENSATYVFRTNAVDFNFLGTYGILNGSAAQGLTYQPIGAPGAIPEPATWAMMIGGFGLVGTAMRRRRRDVMSSVTA